MCKVCDFVRRGLPYLATHPDYNCPTETGFIPDAGAIHAFIHASAFRYPDRIIGKPNVEKSTLINSIIGKKVAITSSKPQTTRNNIQGIYNDDDSQIVFVDTPGIHKPTHKLGNLMNKKAYNNTEGVDVILFLIDISKGFGRGDQFILDKIKDKGVPIFLLLNKIDQVKNKDDLWTSNVNGTQNIVDYAIKYNCKKILFISSNCLWGKNFDYTVTEEDINEFCMGMPRYKRPRKIIFADVPRNPTGKIEKPKLREIYGAKRLVAEQVGR